jgi:hypothetical protein
MSEKTSIAHKIVSPCCLKFVKIRAKYTIEHGLKGKLIMKKLLFIGIILTFIGVTSVFAQRKSVSGAEVTGTFRMNFTGKFKGNSNEIKISALGGGKLQISMDLVYPYTAGSGEMTANMGEADGTATINGDTAIFTPEGTDTCKITIKFVKLGIIKVTEDGGDGGCGFGHNVTSDGTYKKSSGKKPNFERETM